MISGLLLRFPGTHERARRTVQRIGIWKGHPGDVFQHFWALPGLAGAQIVIHAVRIGSDDPEILAGRASLVPRSGRKDGHVTGGQLELLAMFTAELKHGGAANNPSTSCALL